MTIRSATRSGFAVWLFLWLTLFPRESPAQLPDLPELPRDPPSPFPGEAMDLPLLPAPGGDQVRALPTRKVVILRDGPSWWFDRFADETAAELESLARESYDVTIENIDAGNDREALVDAMNRSLGDPTTDLIIAAGYVATQEALALPPEARTRAVLGGAVEFLDYLESAISPEGTSKLPNYSFITEPRRIEADLATLRELSGEQRILVLVEGRVYRTIPDEGQREREKRRIEESTGTRLTLVLVGGDTATEVLRDVPTTPAPVYVSLLPSLPPEEREELFARLAERGQLALSMVGYADVERGALAGLSPDNASTVTKRAALNAHQVLLGIDPTVLPVYLPVEDRLVINRATAETAGWSPDYETALVAEFIDGDEEEAGEALTLERAMEIAACGNVEIRIQREQERISRSDLAQVEALRRPTATIQLEHGFTDYTDRINPILTPDHLNAGTYGLELRQSLYNNNLRSNLGSAVETVAAEKLNTRSRKLDAMESAGLAFLNYLATRSLWQIQKENLRLTENNLQLARLRVSIGAVEAAEVFRWDQDVAASRASVFAAEADRGRARVELNRILGQPREKRWSFEDIPLEDDDTYFLDNVLSDFIENRDDALRFGEFLREVSVPASPELAAFDYLISARGIQVDRVERDYFLPEIAGLIRYQRVGQGNERLAFRTQGETFAGVSLSYNLYEGGLRDAELVGQEALVRQVAAQRERALQQIEQRALNAYFGLFSEHPGIRLSRRALVAAEKNYEAVRTKYAQGAASILDLLDAQSSLLRRRQEEAISVYSFLQEVISMQRSIAWFEHERNDAERQEWTRMFARYMEEGTLCIPPTPLPDRNRQVKEEIATAITREAGGCPPSSSSLHPTADEPSVEVRPAPVSPPRPETVAKPVRNQLFRRILERESR